MSISTLVLLALAAVWAVVLAPEVIKRTSSLRTGDSVSNFARQLSSIGRPAGGRQDSLGVGGRLDRLGNGLAASRRPGNVVDLRSRRPEPAPVSPGVRRRRQEVITVLAAAAVLTLLCAVAFGGLFLWLHLFVDVLLVAYIVLLVQAASGPSAVSGPRSVGVGRLDSRPGPGAPAVIDLRSRSAASGSLYRSPEDAGVVITRVTPIPSRRAAT